MHNGYSVHKKQDLKKLVFSGTSEGKEKETFTTFHNNFSKAREQCCHAPSDRRQQRLLKAFSQYITVDRPSSGKRENGNRIVHLALPRENMQGKEAGRGAGWWRAERDKSAKCLFCWASTRRILIF